MATYREAVLAGKVIALEKRLTLLEVKCENLTQLLGVELRHTVAPTVEVEPGTSLAASIMNNREAVMVYAKIQLDGFLRDIEDPAQRAAIFNETPGDILVALATHFSELSDDPAITRMMCDMAEAAQVHKLTWEELGLRRVGAD
jgi:hypothetical protein